MTTWRIWFLLLLAVLLPMRGAVAAAMLCETSAPAAAVSAAAGSPDTHAAHAGMDHSQMNHGDTEAGHEQPAGSKCTMCSACCTLTPLWSATPSVLGPLDAAVVTFTEPMAPPPSFVSDGPERPPRAI